MDNLDDLLNALTGSDVAETPAVAAAPETVAAPAAAAETVDLSLDDLLGDLDLKVPDSAPEVAASAPETPAVASEATATRKGKGKGKNAAAPAETPAVAPEAEPAAVTEKIEPEAEGEKVEAPAEGEKKVERATRQYFAKKTDRIAFRLGDKLAEYTLRELPADGELTDECIESEKNATMATIDKLGVKPQQRATLILEYLAGKSANLNAVIKDAFVLLHAEGKVEMGNDGNLITVLLKRYSAGSARAMGGNTLIAMKALKIINEDGTINPNSLMYPMVCEKLGLVAQEEQQAA